MHFCGMPSVDPSQTVESLLTELGFEIPRDGERLTVATRVSSGVQPTGRSMPQLLPDGLGPEDHLIVAKSTTHPISRPPSLPGMVAEARISSFDF